MSKPDILAELKRLKLHGMAQAYAELIQNGGGLKLDSSHWLIEHLIDAEHTDRAMRSIRHQMHAARFPIHRDLAGFDFTSAKVDKALIDQLATLDFTEAAHNVVMIGGTGTGKTHLATALGVIATTQHFKRVRFYSTIELVNALELEKAAGKQGRLAYSLIRMDLIILDELGYLALPDGAAELVFQVLSERHERGSLIITTNLPFGEWTKVFPDPRLAKAVVDRLTHRAHIIDTGNESWRFRHGLERKAKKGA